MAAQPKEYFDIETAAKKDSYLIDTEQVSLKSFLVLKRYSI